MLLACDGVGVVVGIGCIIALWRGRLAREIRRRAVDDSLLLLLLRRIEGVVH